MTYDHGTLRIFYEKKMAGVTRLELATSGVTGRHSNQLSYTPAGGRIILHFFA